MSVHRLHLEAQLREIDADEQERARVVRAELARPIATVPHRHRVPHRTARVFVFAKDGRSLCADYLLNWWKRRSSFNGVVARPVSTNEINRLAAILRRLE